MIDVVIPLGPGSTWQNNELRYSLRSIQMHLKNYRNIYILGTRPDWLKNSIDIPCNDVFHASRNIMEKIVLACSCEDLSENFMFWNDDFFLLKNTDAASYPYYYDRYVASHLHIYNCNWYNEYIKETNQVLQQNGLSTKYFDIHTPIIYNKKLFPEVISKFDFNQKLTVKSIYCNALNIPGQQLEDCKIKGFRSAEAINLMIRDRHIFSTGDQCLIDAPTRESAVKILLRNLFPGKSKFEI